MNKKPSSILTAIAGEMSSDSLAKRVTFGVIVVREHGMILGDNPGVSNGVPVTIGWEAQDTFTFDLEQFESVRPEARDMRSMRFRSGRREDIALTAGYDMKQILKVEEEVRRIRESRKKDAKDFLKGKKKFSFRSLLDSTKVKFGNALEPEDFARMDLPDMTKLPIGVSCASLKTIVQNKPEMPTARTGKDNAPLVFLL